MKISFLTSNDNKFREIARTLGSAHELERIEIDLPEIQSLDSHEIIKEKLSAARLELPDTTLIVEDTSFEVDALGGLPGTFMKFFQKGVDDSGIYKMARGLQPTGKLTARAKVIIGLMHREKIRYFEGKIEGQIVEMKNESWGFDRIFIPAGYKERMGVLGEAVKTKISHRAQATVKLKAYLKDLDND